MLRMTQKAGAEFLGTFALVFLGCGGLMIQERLPGSLSPAAIPAIFGLTVASLIYAVGHISGAHFNPAVTLAFSLARHFPRSQVLVYWLAQFGAGLCALGLLHLLLPPGTSFGATVSPLPSLSAVAIETVLSFFLMFVIMSVATDSRAEGTMAGVAIGGMVTVCAWVGGPLTGASMNPARSLAPALFEQRGSHLWIYFVGPAAGAVLAALVYEGIRCATPPNQAKGCC